MTYSHLNLNIFRGVNWKIKYLQLESKLSIERDGERTQLDKLEQKSSLQMREDGCE